ncbi:MAG: class II glutamine amidotransferase [bacterium]|nr:MAG: class II glutamine amidotransferase [bacterium]
MCRLLLIKSHNEFPIVDHLRQFAHVAKHSREYQGHGWGCAYLVDDEWQIYKNIKPIWEDDLEQFGKTTQLLAHARSAFRDEGIKVENNMPFQKDDFIFIFNGELHGVKIKEQGRIGAEKIFNFILRFHKGDLFQAISKAIEIIKKRSQYVRAMNIILSDKKQVYISSAFNEDDDYFTMHSKKSGESLIACSDPYEGESDWHKIPNNTTKVY